MTFKIVCATALAGIAIAASIKTALWVVIGVGVLSVLAVAGYAATLAILNRR